MRARPSLPARAIRVTSPKGHRARAGRRTARVGSYGARVAVAQIRLPGGLVVRRVEEPRPGFALVADGAELPDAECRAVGCVRWPRPEEDVVRAVLSPDRLPELVLVAPGADQEKVEVLAAAMEDHEAELSQFAKRSLVGCVAQVAACQSSNRQRHRGVVRRDVVPLQD